MKIAQIVCTFPPYKGGIGNSAYQFAGVLAKQGHEATVFTPDYTSPLTPLLNRRREFAGENKEQEVDPVRKVSPVGGFRPQTATDFSSPRICQRFFSNGVKIVRLKPLLKYGNAAFLPQLLWKLKGFDIVHLHYPFYGAAEIVILRKILFSRKMNLVVHYHMDSVAKGIKGFIFKLYQWFVLPILASQAKLITCASLDYVKHSALADYYKNHQKKFRQICFGVDLEQFVVYYDHKNKDRREKIILFVGGLDKAHYFKGLENLLKAVKMIKQDFPAELKLNIVGEGDLKPYYQNLARKLGIGKQVYFTEDVDNSRLVDYYNYCDAVVLPSINKGEAFGLVLLEAMACAKPIIASNLPGVRSIFKNGEHGLLVQPGSVDDLADKLKIILSDKELAQKMGQAGRKLVEDKYTWEKVGKRLDLIYHQVQGV